MSRLDRMRDAFAPAPEHFHQHMEYTLAHMEELTMKRRHKLGIIAIVLVLILLAGVALAAASFGILDFLSHEDDEGNVIVNDAVRPLVQPVEQTLEGEAARLTVHDAICDGETLALAWTLENKLPDAALYTVWSFTVNRDEITLDGGESASYEFFLGEGETKQSGTLYGLYLDIGDDRLQVDLRFSLLAAQGEVVFYKDPLSEEEIVAYERQRMDDRAAGKLVTDAGGRVEVSWELRLENESTEDALVRLGYMQRVEVLSLPLTLDITRETVDLLPFVAEAEVTFDSYTMILTEAVKSPMQLHFTIDYVLAGEKEANDFREARGALAIWPDVDAGDWYGGAESGILEGMAQPDGTYLLRYTSNVSDVWRMPDTFTLAVRKVNMETGGFAPYPNETFTFSITE